MFLQPPLEDVERVLMELTADSGITDQQGRTPSWLDRTRCD